jgi:hypothetical protein
MSRLGAGYVRKWLLELDFGTGHVRSRDWICLEMVIVTRLPNRTCEGRDDQTCPGQETDMFSFAYWNPTMDPDKFGGLRKFEWPKHVWVGAGHVLFCLLKPSQEMDMSEFSGELDSKKFFDDLHFTNSPNVSPLIVRSSWETNKIKTL